MFSERERENINKMNINSLRQDNLEQESKNQGTKTQIVSITSAILLPFSFINIP